MKSQQKLILSSITLAILALCAQARAAEPAAAPAATPADAAKDGVNKEIQTVVVTGSASAKGVRKLDAAYSITTASEEQIKEASPSSTADLFKIVPGVFAEATGGTAGANIEVRGFPSGGDAPFVSVQMNGSPLFPAPTLSFLENSSLFRYDDTVERVEVLRGGPSPIYSNGQPGATMNFILKKGDDTPEGSLRATVGTGNLHRVDGYYGGKLGDGWYASVGGFYRTSQGVRDTQFPADDGGQLSATLTRKLTDGELTLYARATSDKNAFFTGLPLQAATANGAQPSAFPGFNPLTGTLYGNELRNVTLQVGPNQSISKDLADGRGLHASVFGADFAQTIEGWAVSNKMNYLSGTAPTLALFTGNPPTTLGSYISSAIASANGTPAVVKAAGRLATSGSATYTNGGGAVDMNQQVLEAGMWSVDKDLKSFTDEFRVSKELFPGHTVTAGAYVADFSSRDVWYLGNSMLLTATSNARPVNVNLNNGVVVSGNGFDGASFFTLNENFTGHNTAAYLANEWKIDSVWSVDAGLRRERQRIDGTVSNPISIDLDNNPLTVYNNNASVLSGTNTALSQTDSATSYTAGGGFKLASNTNLFVRINSGAAFPQFDNIRGTDPNGISRAPVVKVRQYELGLKTVGSLYSLYLTAFHTDFKGLQFSQILANGQQINAIAGSSGNGLEFEAALRPTREFQIAFTGDYQDSSYKDFTGDAASQNGNTVQRQPKFQSRLTPSYRLPMQWGAFKFYGTYTYIGDRWSDTQNQQLLPKYHTFDAGILAQVGDKIEFRLSGTNLTNELGLTEGNARIIGGGSGGVVIARPIFGRAVEASVLYRF